MKQVSEGTGRMVVGWAVLAALMMTMACRPKGPEPPAKSAAVRNTYQNEQEWIVATVVGSLGAMARHACGGGVASVESALVRALPVEVGAPPRFAVDVDACAPVRGLQIAVQSHIWSPNTFKPLAERLLTGRSSQAGLAPEDNVGAVLTDFRIEVIEETNRRLSERLTANPLDPTLHEQAALLLGALSLHEVAGPFSDIRHQICRLTAHLAFASVLRRGGTPSLDGQLAEALLLNLVGRTADAVARLDALAVEPSSPAAAWVRAIRLTATRDWRLLPDPKNASLLERFIDLRVINDRLDPNRALDLLDEQPQEEWAELGRVLRAGDQAGRVTVEICNRFLPEETDLAEARRVLGVEASSVDTPLVEALNTAPSLGGVVRAGDRSEIFVIDRGTWAAFEQRHVLSGALEAHTCLNTLGLPHRRKERWAADDRLLSSLRLFPLLSQQVAADSPSHEKAAMAALLLVQQSPEVVTAANWICLLKRTAYGSPPAGAPPERAWFAPPLPWGTAFQAGYGRLYGPDGDRRPAESIFKSMLALDPYDSETAFAFATVRYGNPAPYAKLKEVLGPAAEYDVNSAYQLARSAHGKDAAAFAEWSRKVCDLNIDYCRHVAKWALEGGREQDAAALFHRWADGARDRVTVSNFVGWLVDYELKRGRNDEALRLARDAASTYSQAGLETLARVLERTRDLRQAEDLYRRIAERYDAPGMPIGFYKRMVERGDKRYQASLQSALKPTIPAGLEKAETPIRTDPPADGVLVVAGTADTAKAGLKPGNVIVALDGYKVHNREQYRIVRSFTNDPAMIFLVWNSTTYVELHAHQEGRRFGTEFANYPQR